MELVWAKMGATRLQQLAQACPLLESLTVLDLRLRAECHASPMRALTSLVLLEHCRIWEHIRMAEV